MNKHRLPEDLQWRASLYDLTLAALGERGGRSFTETLCTCQNNGGRENELGSSRLMRAPPNRALLPTRDSR
jgi:hypothetical protein